MSNMSNNRSLTGDDLDDQMPHFFQDLYGPVYSGDEMWQKLASKLEAAPALGSSTITPPEPPERVAVTPTTRIWPSGMRQRLGSAVAVLVTGIIVVVSVALFQRHGPVSQQSVRPTATSEVGCPPAAIRATLPKNASLDGTSPDPYGSAVALTSPTSGWAVGGIFSLKPADQPSHQSVIEQFKDCRWSPVGPTLPGVGLFSISMTSPDDGWIIGTNDGTDDKAGYSVLLHLVAGRWQLVPVPQAANTSFNSLSMLSATEGWIIGSPTTSMPGQPDNPILLHLHNGHWSAVTIPFARPTALMAMSPDVAWVASGTEPTNELFHYQQGKWTSVPVPSGMNIYSLHRNGPDDAWATGQLQSSSTPSGANPSGYTLSPALLHFNGTSWSLVALNGLQNPMCRTCLEDLHMLSANEGWAVGTVDIEEGTPTVPAVIFPLHRVTLLQHYVAGRWRQVALPDAPLADITSFSCASPDDCWALGASVTVVPDAGGFMFFYPTSLLHYYNGRWTIY